MKGAMNCMMYPPQSLKNQNFFYGPVQCPEVVHQQINIAQVLTYEETFITQLFLMKSTKNFPAARAKISVITK